MTWEQAFASENKSLRRYRFGFDFSRAVPETTKNVIFEIQNNMSSRDDTFLELWAGGWNMRAWIGN